MSYPRPIEAPAPRNDTAEPELLHEFFTRAARQWPGNVAIDVPPSPTRPHRRTLTYAELDRRSDALAAYLREFVTGECVVAVLLPRDSEHVYLAQLAALKAGAAYVCIEPSFPDAQVATILGDARPVVVLSDAAGAARVRTCCTNPRVVDVVAWAAHYADRDTNLAPAGWLTPRSLAYLIYTSGTTGRPKGVMIEHGAVANLVRGDLATFPSDPHERIGQNSSCAYDSSVDEIWMALAVGATLVVMDDETTRLGPDLVPWLRAERINAFSPPPTLLRTCGAIDAQHLLPDLNRIHVGGEPLPRDVADRWAPGRTLVNDYGPTECSVVALRAVIRAGDPLTIGRPVPGIRAHVLNDRLEEVDDGGTGELCLSGVGLARGYLNDPDLTARKFPVHPRFGRIYRTGDLVHRDASGDVFCHGRIDTQVKVRGYRIELEAIESRLVACAGVRGAACRVQGEGPQQQIVAFIVPADPAAPPHFDDLKAAVRAHLPEYTVPAHFGLLAALPVSVSGKLNRRALPTLEVHATEVTGTVVAPRTDHERRVAVAAQKALGVAEAVSVEHDFFNDLGGDSLRAAGLISLLRDDPVTASLTVRDLYEARTLAGLAKRVGPPAAREAAAVAPTATGGGHPVLATLVQVAWLLAVLVSGGPLVYLAVEAVPDLTGALGLVPFVLLSPLLYFGSVAAYAAAAVLFTVAVKWLLIGRYRPCREPVWGSFYVRNWIVRQAANTIPWAALDGTVFKGVVLRALGAKIGARVHIDRGVDLTQGGWDLLDIGDDVTLSRESAVRVVELDAGHVVVSPVVLEAGSTLAVRAGVAGNTRVGTGGYLTPLSFLTSGSAVPPGECWEGVPAVRVGPAPERPAVSTGRDLSPVAHGLVTVAARALLGAFLALPMIAVVLSLAAAAGVDADRAAEWVSHPSASAPGLLLGAALVCLAVPLRLAAQCAALRLMGRVPEGVASRWGLGYVRVWLKTGVMDSANAWLSGTLMWRVWLRCAGMKVGRNSEVGTIVDTVPEMVEIGSETFFADGIYLAGPRLHQGTVTVGRVRLGDGDFLGNHAVVPPGQTVPDGVLLGVCTVADDTRIRPGTSWFGHPPFELPNREVVEADRSVTHEPSWPRYLSRIFWEVLRFALPMLPAALAVAWLGAVAALEPVAPLAVLLFGVVPALDLAFLGALCFAVLAMKWVLLGRVKPGTHPLWSCWCSRWDFHYVAWEMYARAALAALEGTLLLNAYLRLMGVRIGRRVVLGSGFAHVVDPDMLSFGDGATVSAAFQAHTFEDRVLKIDYVTVGAGATLGNQAVLLYGADVGAGTKVVAHSVVMKRERLQPRQVYAGCPTRPV